MKLGLIPLAVLVLIFCLAASSALAPFDIQDLPPSQSPAASQATDQSATSNQANTPAEPKKAKRVWTNENLTEVSGTAISQIGDAKNGASRKGTAAKPASSQVVARFRKQLAAFQAQLAVIDKQIADLKSFSKGESSGANGLQMHKSYTMEPVQDQVLKLEEKRKIVAAQMDSVFDAARKRGIEPGQLR
jgi:hypothetical protein